jgi:hypothetical protein
MPELSPWHQRTPAECGHDEQHDPATCTTCGPIVGSAAWTDGAARALEVQTHLPMTSAAPDAKAGRDGYELPT